MASELYTARALEKHDRRAKIRVEVVHPDSNCLFEDPGFALSLLVAGAPGASPLAQEVSREEALDPVWLRRYTLGFVESVRLEIHSGTPGDLPEEDPPPDETPEEEDARLELRSQSWLEGTYTIDVTDPAWLAHVHAGEQWGSYALSGAAEYEPHAPIRPGDANESSTTVDGFLWAPRELWAQQSPPATTPALVRIPAYGPGAYRAIEARSGSFTADDLRALHGRAVRVCGKQTRETPSIEVLVLEGKSISLLSARGGMERCDRLEGTIGLAELKPGARLGERLGYDWMLGGVKPMLHAASHDGHEATFSIRLAPGTKLPERVEVGTAFYLLMAPLVKKKWELELEPAPLSRAIMREVRRISPNRASSKLPSIAELVSTLAKGFVASFAVAAPPDSASLEGATDAEARRVLESPWPEAKIRVVPHDPAFLAHLDRPFAPMPVHLWYGTPKPWDGSPAKA